VLRLEDALERNPGPLGGLADGVCAPFELTQHDLVFRHQDRAEVADGPLVMTELRGSDLDASIQCVEVGAANPGPEALGHEARSAVPHAATLGRIAQPRKGGKPYEIGWPTEGPPHTL